MGMLTPAILRGQPNVRNIPYTNMRDWLRKPISWGSEHVSGASWERDIGMATEVVQHSETAPCVVLTTYRHDARFARSSEFLWWEAHEYDAGLST